MSPLAQKLLEITKSEKESKYWGLSTQARKKIERLIEEHDPKWPMHPQEFDILIRTGIGEKSESRGVILGHEERLDFTNWSSMGVLRALNITLWSLDNERRERRRRAFAMLDREMRATAGIPRWAPWRKVPQDHHAAWVKVVKQAEKDVGENGTNLDIAELAIATWRARAARDDQLRKMGA